MKRYYFKAGEFNEKSELEFVHHQVVNDNAFLDELFHEYRLSPGYSNSERIQYDYDFDGVIERYFINWKGGDEKKWIEHTLNVLHRGWKIEKDLVKAKGIELNAKSLKNYKIIIRWLYNKLSEITSGESLKLNSDIATQKIKWLGKPSQLGYLFLELSKKGFIKIPEVKGNSSYSKLASLCWNGFEINSTLKTLEKEFTPKTNSLTEANRDEFTIPSLKDLS